MGNLKSGMRLEFLKLRDALTEAELEEKSGRIAEKLFSTNIYRNSQRILCYMDFRNEVRTGKLIKKALADGKKISLPRVENRTGGIRDLLAFAISDIENDLEPGTYGILEPKQYKLQRMEPGEIDLVLVPGVVFDMKKYRIGYGAGYYDRFLNKVGKDCIKAGLAFEIQIKESVPVQGHDIPMDLVITEDRVIL